MNNFKLYFLTLLICSSLSITPNLTSSTPILSEPLMSIQQTPDGYRVLELYDGWYGYWANNETYADLVPLVTQDTCSGSSGSIFVSENGNLYCLNQDSTTNLTLYWFDPVAQKTLASWSFPYIENYDPLTRMNSILFGNFEACRQNNLQFVVFEMDTNQILYNNTVTNLPVGWVVSTALLIPNAILLQLSLGTTTSFGYLTYNSTSLQITETPGIYPYFLTDGISLYSNKVILLTQFTTGGLGIDVYTLSDQGVPQKQNNFTIEGTTWLTLYQINDTSFWVPIASKPTDSDVYVGVFSVDENYNLVTLSKVLVQTMSDLPAYASSIPGTTQIYLRFDFLFYFDYELGEIVNVEQTTPILQDLPPLVLSNGTTLYYSNQGFWFKSSPNQWNLNKKFLITWFNTPGDYDNYYFVAATIGERNFSVIHLQLSTSQETITEVFGIEKCPGVISPTSVQYDQNGLLNLVVFCGYQRFYITNPETVYGPFNFGKVESETTGSVTINFETGMVYTIAQLLGNLWGITAYEFALNGTLLSSKNVLELGYNQAYPLSQNYGLVTVSGLNSQIIIFDFANMSVYKSIPFSHELSSNVFEYKVLAYGVSEQNEDIFSGLAIPWFVNNTIEEVSWINSSGQYKFFPGATDFFGAGNSSIGVYQQVEEIPVINYNVYEIEGINQSQENIQY